MSRTQLRIYTIAPGHFDEFIDAWKAGILPLRRQLGFDVRAWTDADANALVWLLRYDGEGTFEDADAAYHGSPERQAMQPDPAQWIAAQEIRWIEPLDA